MSSAEHGYWGRVAKRLREAEERFLRDNLRHMTHKESEAAAIRSWRATSFPWCEHCNEHTSGVKLCHWCDTDKVTCNA